MNIINNKFHKHLIDKQNLEIDNADILDLSKRFKQTFKRRVLHLNPIVNNEQSFQSIEYQNEKSSKKINRCDKRKILNTEVDLIEEAVPTKIGKGILLSSTIANYNNSTILSDIVPLDTHNLQSNMKEVIVSSEIIPNDSTCSNKSNKISDVYIDRDNIESDGFTSNAIDVQPKMIADTFSMESKSIYVTAYESQTVYNFIYLLI